MAAKHKLSKSQAIAQDAELDLFWKTRLAAINQYLDENLPHPTKHPRKLHEAMRYSVHAGGKRLRPLLLFAACEMFGGTIKLALPAAAAIECIHTYSLIHDDLPCMDNDDLRRGKPTCHKVFGEAIALLAGDALLTEAFAFVARIPGGKFYHVKEYLAALAEAAGSRFLIGGQAADIEAEGKPEVTPAHLRRIHLGKTAAMIAVSLRLGAMCAQAQDADVQAMEKFGRELGLAFQITDDLLDITQTAEVLGKTAGKDVAAGKATYPSVYGIEAARRAAERSTRRALDHLRPYDERAAMLRAIAMRLLTRTH